MSGSSNTTSTDLNPEEFEQTAPGVYANKDRKDRKDLILFQVDMNELLESIAADYRTTAGDTAPASAGGTGAGGAK